MPHKPQSVASGARDDSASGIDRSSFMEPSRPLRSRSAPAAAPSLGALLSMPVADVEEKAAERFSLALLAAAAAVACAAVVAKGHQ